MEAEKATSTENRHAPWVRERIATLPTTDLIRVCKYYNEAFDERGGVLDQSAWTDWKKAIQRVDRENRKKRTDAIIAELDTLTQEQKDRVRQIRADVIVSRLGGTSLNPEENLDLWEKAILQVQKEEDGK